MGLRDIDPQIEMAAAWRPLAGVKAGIGEVSHINAAFRQQQHPTTRYPWVELVHWQFTLGKLIAVPTSMEIQLMPV